MKTTKLHTFEGILTEGIYVDGQEDPIKVSCLFIPKIQRSYAQGRKKEDEVRNDFLDDIFATLTSDSDVPLELSFLFGSKQKLINGSTEGFELLDGQQRTTTLFLLYWYIYQREKKEGDTLPEFLSKFTYETRDTSADFLSKITAKIYLDDKSQDDKSQDNKSQDDKSQDDKSQDDKSQDDKSQGNKSPEIKKPSDVLRAQIWFTDDFNCDPTICAMLNMLDDIHARYEALKRVPLADKLCRLKFYVLLLEKFDMNDELYIKMNSRGLPLIPFENFKASLVRYMKKHPEKRYGDDNSVDGQMPYWLSFTSKIDTEWIDIFWKNPLLDNDQPSKIDDREIGNRYFRFFNRYFFTKAAIIKGGEDGKALVTFFYKDCEEPDFAKRLKGWQNYLDLFKEIEKHQEGVAYPVFASLERIFNIYREYQDFILGCIREDPFSNTSSFDVLEKGHYTLFDRVAFAAFTEFVEALPEGRGFDDDNVKTNFKRMLRIVHNVIENTQIENDGAAIGVIRAIHEIVQFDDATTGNFYKSLASNSNEVSSRNDQLRDELEKCEEMFDGNGNFDSTWEDAFREAEKHDFFKGSVTFFFSPKAGSSDDFRNRYNIVKDLFDAKGISEEYRNNGHILIRAIISCYNHWGNSGLKERYFTENSEKNKYLKMLLTDNSDVRNMFCDFFNKNTDIKNNPDIKSYLVEFVNNAKCRPEEEVNKSFKMLYHRLVNDENAAAIYDAVAIREKARGCFRILNNRSYIIIIPGKWYDQLVLDTERNKIIPYIAQTKGFDYENDDQKNEIESPLHDYWRWAVELRKSVNLNNHDYTIKLRFNEYKNCEFFVFGNNVANLEEAFGITYNTVIDGVKLPDALHYQFEENSSEKKAIIDKIDEIESKLQSIQ